jgi:hypothetical protein
MGFGFPPRFAASRSFELQHQELVEIIRTTLEDLGWQFEMLSSTRVQARTPRLFLGSWGEQVAVEIQPEGVLAVESRSILWPGFDMGRNETNVRRFFSGFIHAERMYRLVETPPGPPPAYDERGLSPVQRIINPPEDD